MKQKIKTLALAVCVGSGLVAVNTAVAQEQILDVVQEALAYNPELKSKLNAFNASVFDKREAFGGYLPSVDVNASMGSVSREHDSRGHFSRNQAEIALTQMLFDGFNVRSKVAKAQHSSLVRYYELLDEAEAKAFEVTDAYLSVLRYRELVEEAQQNVNNHQTVHGQISQRAERGVSNRADLLQIEGRLALAETNLLTEVANLQTVTAKFQRLVGRLPSEQMSPVPSAQLSAPQDFQQVISQVYSNNPALHAAFENINVAEASVAEAKSGRYPTLEFGARHGTYRNTNSFDNRSKDYNYGDESVVELRARYNLYRGGSDRAAERSALSRVSQAEDLRNKACVDLRQTASIAYSDIQNLTVKQNALESHRDGAVKVVTAYREQFDIGRRSLLDVLDSENEAFQARRAYTHGHYDLLSANAKTLQSMGQLLNTLSANTSNMPTLSEVGADSLAETSAQYCAQYEAQEWNLNNYIQPAKKKVLELSGDALFDTGSAVIKPNSLPSLTRFVETLMVNGMPKEISIVGHTDSTGSEALNRKLSLDRAVSVRNFLIERGVDRTIISAAGVASNQPVASNDTAAGREANRRVSLTVSSN